MTLPSSGTISLNDIQTEFGGTNPISLSEYYSAAVGIPASGTISLNDFYNASAATIEFDSASYSISAEAGGILTMNTDGSLSYTGSGGSLYWAQPITTDIGDGYECRLVLISGTTPFSSLVNTWLPLTSTRSWSWVNFGGSGTFVTFSGTLSIRPNSGATIDTANISVSISGSGN